MVENMSWVSQETIKRDGFHAVRDEATAKSTGEASKIVKDDLLLGPRRRCQTLINGGLMTNVHVSP